MATESLAATIAREAAAASGGRVAFETTFLPPLSIDLAALARPGPAVPPPPSSNVAAELVAQLTRPTLRVEGAGAARRIPLTSAGVAPQSPALQAILPALALAEVGLAAYGAWHLARWALSRSGRRA